MERLKPLLRTVSRRCTRSCRDGPQLRVRTEAVEYIADRVIFAAPTFLAPYIVEGAPRAEGSSIRRGSPRI